MALVAQGELGGWPCPGVTKAAPLPAPHLVQAVAPTPGSPAGLAADKAGRPRDEPWLESGCLASKPQPVLGLSVPQPERVGLALEVPTLQMQLGTRE